MRHPADPGQRVLELRLALLLAVAAVLLAACARAPGGPIAIQSVPDPPAHGWTIKITGLSSDEVAAIATANLDEASWQRFFVVTVTGATAPPVSGRYEAADGSATFRPAFTFDPGRSYTARFDPQAMPRPRADTAITTTLTFGTVPTGQPTAVTALYPSGDVWPENMLRFYILFSRPMSRGHRTDYVHLLDDAGAEIPDAILSAYSDLWNQDATRLTVFFDPGRVKRGIGPNVKLGRAIVSGRRYSIKVDSAWPDAEGRPLESTFVRGFTAGPAAYGALSVADWTLSSPHAGTTEPLSVQFPGPLDHALIERAIGVRTAAGADLAGKAAAGPQELSWTFAPSAAWSAGNYQLVILTLLEDPAGNKIGRAFEVLADSPDADAKQPDIVSRAFQVN
jgi:hypothetical protein